MNEAARSVFKRAMREAVKLTKVSPNDTDKDIVGKLFNHFHQNLNGHTLTSYELAKQIPRQMKRFGMYSNETTLYVGKLLSAALTEVNKINRNDEFDALKSSLYSMKAMVNEASRVNEKSERVLSQLQEIERNMSND